MTQQEFDFTSAPQFPRSGYHNDICSRTTNTISIFDFVKLDEMYTIVDTRDSLSYETRYWIKSKLYATTDVVISLEDDAPFSWKGLTTKSDDCEFQGSFLKRLTNYFWKAHQIKLDNKIIGAIGDISGKDLALAKNGTPIHFRFDPIAAYIDGEFGDEGSCFWESRQGARVLIRNEGGSFIEFFDNPDAFIHPDWHTVTGGKGIARAWIVPVNQFIYGWKDTPAFTLCNIYVGGSCSLSRFSMARAVATAMNMSYSSVSVHSNRDVMWVNSGGGFLISPDAQIFQNVNEVKFEYSWDYDDINDPHLDGIAERGHLCSCCGEYVDEDYFNFDLDMCTECVNESYTVCDECGNYFHNEDDENIQFIDRTKEHKYSGYFCRRCAERMGYYYCDECGNYRKGTVETVSGDYVCQSCFEDDYFECPDCNEVYRISDGFDLDGEMYCEECYDERKSNLESEEQSE